MEPLCKNLTTAFETPVSQITSLAGTPITATNTLKPFDSVLVHPKKDEKKEVKTDAEWRKKVFFSYDSLLLFLLPPFLFSPPPHTSSPTKGFRKRWQKFRSPRSHPNPTYRTKRDLFHLVSRKIGGKSRRKGVVEGSFV